MHLSWSSFVSTLSRYRWLIAILFLAAALRLYRLPAMASYDFDQEFVTTFVLDVVRVYPIRYIGQGMSIPGIFMGPWYFYYLVPFYVLFGLNPLGGYVGSVILGLGIIASYYFVGRSLFNEKVGLLAAFLRATSVWAISADWAMVPSYSSDLLIIWSLWLLWQMWHGKKWSLPVLALVLGLFTSFHPIQLPMVIVSGVIFLVSWRRLRPAWWLVLLSAGLFVIPSLPLLYFDYLRHFAMVTQMMEMFTQGRSGEAVYAPWQEKWPVMVAVLRNFWNDLVFVPRMVQGLGTVLLLMAVGLVDHFVKRSRSADVFFHRLVIGLLGVVLVVYYSVFPSHVPEYYLGAARAVMYLYLAVALWDMGKRRWGKWLLALSLVWITCWNQWELKAFWQRDLTISFADKQRVVQTLVEHTQGQPYRLSMIAQLGWGWGFESLLRVTEHEPSQDGPVYSIVTPLDMIESQEEIDYRSGNIGLIFPDSENSEK